jgi:hypothetical protein
MDALALLCTLYAEGPVTLARLRDGGCATIEDVLARDAQHLAPILLATEATAQRFQREARNLHERVGAEGLTEPRARTIDAHASGSALPKSSGVVSHSTRPAAGIDRQSVLDRVLAAWRERDEHDEHDHLEERNDGTGYEREEILQPASPTRTITPAAARNTDVVGGIPAGALDGLDAEAASALARAGIRDLSALAACDTLKIARTSGLSWSRLSRLSALARRVPGFAPTGATEITRAKNGLAEEKVSPSERPTADREASPDRGTTADRAPARHFASQAPEGAGGPFA